MTTKRWFRTQESGWGWVPETPEGWQLLILYVLVLLFVFVRVREEAESSLAALSTFIIHMVIATIALVAISYWKGDR